MSRLDFLALSASKKENCGQGVPQRPARLLSPVCIAAERGFDCILMNFPTAGLQRAASKNTSSTSLPYSKKGDKAGIIQAFHAQYI